MIKIPKCFYCEHYKDGKCKAYPCGIPLTRMAKKTKDEECAYGIKFKEK